MSEQLQHLIEKIRSEGVGKAEAEGRAIVDRARQEAARIEQEAREQAAALVKKAEADAAARAERGRKALEQASRDTLLTVRQTLETLFDKLFRRQVETTLTHEAFRDILKGVIESYVARGTAADNLVLTVPAGQEAAVRDHLLKTFQAEAARGVHIRSSNEVVAGFRIALRDSHVEHDFTPDAIAEALARLVRPDLGALLREAAAGVKGGPPAP